MTTPHPDRSSSPARVRTARGLLRRFRRRQDGATAVEFALIAAPFIAMTFAIIETALVFFAGQVLETAAADGARLVMTGQADAQKMTAIQFKSAVCSRIYGLFDCAGGLLVDVKSYSEFASIDTSKPVSNGQLNENTSYSPGNPGDIVLVRLMYKWPTYVSFMGFDLQDITGNRVLMSTVAFRNEPYK